MSDEAYRRLLDEHTWLQARYQTLQRVLHLCGRPDDFETVFEQLIDACVEAFGAKAAAIYMHDQDRDELYFAAARGPKAREVLDLDIALKPNQGFAGVAFSQREVLAVSDASSDPRFAQEVSAAVGYDVRNLLAAPILCDEQALGVLQILNKHGGDFTAEEVAFAGFLGRAMGGLVGLGLHLGDLRHALEAQETSS